MTRTAASQWRLSITACITALALLVTFLAPAIPATAATGDEFWDDRFGLPGLYNADIETIASAPNGDLYVAGSFRDAAGTTFNNIAHWDGYRWNALGSGVSGSWQRVRQIDVADDGSVYVVGGFTSAGNVAAKGIARWTGTDWTLVGNGVGPQTITENSTQDADILAVAVGPDGVYIGGNFTHIDGVEVNGIARWDGTSWSALGRGVGKINWEGVFEAGATVYDIAFDGTIVYAGGVIEAAGDELQVYGVAAWDGTSWSGLGTGLRSDNGYSASGNVRALAVAGGKLYAGGLFVQADGKPVSHIAMWDGITWNAIGSGVSKDYATEPLVLDMLPVGDSVYVAGNFTRAGGQAIAGLARLDGTTFTAAGSALESYYDVEVVGLDYAPDGGIYVGGDFHSVDGGQVNGVALLQNGAWDALGRGVVTFGDTPAEVRASAMDAAGRVYIGGQFSFAGGVSVKNLAMWDGEDWNDIGGGVEGGAVSALLTVGDDLYVAGSFTKAGTISASRIARWNMTTKQWFPLGTGINGDVYALAYANGVVYAGGGFSSAGGTAAWDVAAWNGANWSPLGGGYRIFELTQEGSEAGTTVYALAVSGSSLFIGGRFQTIQQGQGSDKSTLRAVHNLVEWQSDTQQWLPLAIGNENPGVTYGGYSGFQIDVSALEVVGDSLYVGGRFNMAGGAVSASNLARWNIVNPGWQQIEGIGGIDESRLQVNALDSYGNDLFIAGAFTSAGPVEARYIGRFNTQTNSWSTLGSGAKWYNDLYTAITSVVVGESGVYVGGKFDQAGLTKSVGFGRWAGPLDPGVTPPPPPPPPPGQFKIYLPQVGS